MSNVNGNSNEPLTPTQVNGQDLENKEKKEWLPIRGIKWVGRQVAKIPEAVREHPKAAAVVFTAIGVGIKTGFDAIRVSLADEELEEESPALLPEAVEEEENIVEEETTEDEEEPVEV